jgi:sugar-specific transcriptional regulator TrmB
MGNWVEPHSPEGYLKRMQEQYDQAWDDWFETRSQSARERLDRAEQQLQQAKGNKAANDEAKARWEGKLRAEKEAREAKHEEELNQRLEPAKQRAKRQWLYDHL